ncbi:MAG TPA: quinolinate synthase NadA, partial [Flavobacteriales bacterium]|nr:quinolinate synthase NadA [Flavobacteriales bacterium]
LNAGCSLADSCPPQDLQQLKKENPNHVVVSYINCSAEVKAMSDIICTSSNAIRVVESIPEDKEIIFAPDKNLGRYVSEKTGRQMLIWDGECEVHVEFSTEKIERIRKAHPEAKLIAHPESQQQILDQSEFIGSTSALLNFVQEDDAPEYIVATEVGILHKMKQLAPNKVFIPAPITANNTCACSECPYMKLNTLEKIYNCMKNGKPQIYVEENTRQAAVKSLDRMLSLG